MRAVSFLLPRVFSAASAGGGVNEKVWVERGGRHNGFFFHSGLRLKIPQEKLVGDEDDCRNNG